MPMTRRRTTLAASGLLFLLGATALLLGLGSRPGRRLPVPVADLPDPGHVERPQRQPPEPAAGPARHPQCRSRSTSTATCSSTSPWPSTSIELGGVISNPPNPASILQPNVQIDRLLTTPLLGQSTPPSAHRGQAPPGRDRLAAGPTPTSASATTPVRAAPSRRRSRPC